MCRQKEMERVGTAGRRGCVLAHDSFHHHQWYNIPGNHCVQRPSNREHQSITQQIDTCEILVKVVSMFVILYVIMYVNMYVNMRVHKSRKSSADPLSLTRGHARAQEAATTAATAAPLLSTCLSHAQPQIQNATATVGRPRATQTTQEHHVVL